MHTTYVTSLTSAGGLASFFRIAISFPVIHLTASSAALSAGRASASYVSQSTLIALASSAILEAAASSTDTDAFILSAASVSYDTMTSLALVSFPV
jgi:hypothetical protein